MIRCYRLPVTAAALRTRCTLVQTVTFLQPDGHDARILTLQTTTSLGSPGTQRGLFTRGIIVYDRLQYNGASDPGES